MQKNSSSNCPGLEGNDGSVKFEVASGSEEIIGRLNIGAKDCLLSVGFG